MMHRRQEDPHPRRRKRRLEAILEIPQRVHPQEIQSEAPSRLSEHQESLRASHSTCNTSCGSSETNGGKWSCGSGAEESGGGDRDAGSFWGFNSLCGSELVSGCMFL